MNLPAPGEVGEAIDLSVSELLEQWVAEQVECAGAETRARPRIGVLAARGVLRDGGWPVYGGDAPTAHAILEAGGLPCLIPPLPLLPGYDPLQLFCDEHTFALCFEVLWPLVRDLDGLVFAGGDDLEASLYEQSPTHRPPPLTSGATCGSALWRSCPGCSACPRWASAAACR